MVADSEADPDALPLALPDADSDALSEADSLALPPATAGAHDILGARPNTGACVPMLGVLNAVIS